jgi:hypothetical protein
MALVANYRGDGYHVYLTPTGDFNLTAKEETPIKGCPISWRPDGHVIAVMQPDLPRRPTATGAVVAPRKLQSCRRRAATDAGTLAAPATPAAGAA